MEGLRASDHDMRERLRVSVVLRASVVWTKMRAHILFISIVWCLSSLLLWSWPGRASDGSTRVDLLEAIRDISISHDIHVIWKLYHMTSL